jgi:F-type H+-transporting ATPase subunit epsilon
MTLQVQIVSPERVLWSGDAEQVTTRVVEGGDITFLTGHIPYLGALEIGPLTVRPAEGDDLRFAVHGGFVEVSEDLVSVLSDVAEATEAIDPPRAQAALAAAEARLRDEPADPQATAARRRAKLRLGLTGTESD